MCVSGLSLRKVSEQIIEYNKLTTVKFDEKDVCNSYGKTGLVYKDGLFTNMTKKRVVFSISSYVSWKLGEESRGRFGLHLTTDRQNVSETSLSFSTSPATFPIKMSSSVSTSLCPGGSIRVEVINLSKDGVPLYLDNGYVSIVRLN